MKIGLVCKYFLSTRGGLERDTRLLSEELVKRGHEVHVFCNSGEQTAGVTLHHVPMFPFSSPGKNLSFALMATRHCSDLELDVIQSMERIWTQDIYRTSDSINPVQMKSKYHNKMIYLFKAAGPRRQVLSFLERRIFQEGGAKFILAISNLVKTQIMEHYQVPEEKIVVIYNSVDTNRFNQSLTELFKKEIREQFGVGPKEKLILFMGNNYKLKGLSLLLKALVSLKAEAFKLLVAGTDLAAPYMRFAAQNGIGDKVRFIGYHKYPERLYAAADLFVFPSSDDTFGNVCLEAMACGVPVIASKMAGASEIIDQGINGYVLNTLGSEELSARIREVLHRGDYSMMRMEAAKKAAEFTIERHMKQLCSLYARVREMKIRERQ
jgi:UDP-glucose:(heptosyl)LPS alpha-1,3-glucosyltransferase